MLARPRRTLSLLLTSLLATAALTACGNDGDDSLPPPAAPPTASDQPVETISLTPEEERAVEEAKAKFDEFMNAYVEEATTGEPLDTPAGRVIGGHPMQHLEGGLSPEIQAEFVERYNNGQIAEGELRWEFDSVQDVDLDRVVDDRHLPWVWLRYCIDPTEWRIIDSSTGEEVNGPSERQLAIVEALWTDDQGGTRAEGWWITAREWTGQPC